ncbi:import inner membrane translocase subunit tim-21 [Sodiomyces alkalinus F11]|uniref:Mitochondrial import inner membrane translocase subunit Tim21 n=1 Tax=Sodiomyces alkalinus (strain CBS 110278 / VKM F-3762 / F11) TaxID=1314773 RepID=A0A3N2Q1D6_SODAK|nr:import inner membrane translocase subunit tim-21 [Sodiomyces alkalinus F11]ROT40573.1 import inner membrane translocase subunit tim-21 [Sodiomyces alkalinus F11]
MNISSRALSIRTPATTAAFHPAAFLLRPLTISRCYATPTGLGTTLQGSKRRTVTPFNDDGRVPWSELSASEKASRATQQSFNFGLILLGIVCTGGVGYYLYTDVFSPDSKTAYFNRVVDRIKQEPTCLEVLGDAKKITAHGDETYNKWRRSRPIASTTKTDPKGNDHLLMNFYLEGPLNRGRVHLHMIRPAGHSDYEYKYLYLDVKGHHRIYLENADTSPNNPNKSKFRFLGINWG